MSPLKNQKIRPEYDIEVCIDYIGNPQFYSGHSHAFVSENLKGCIQFSIYIDPSSSFSLIVDTIVEDIESQEWLDPEGNTLDRHIVDSIPTEEIIHELENHIHNNYIGHTYIHDLLDYESPVNILGYMHIWEKGSD